MTSEEDVLNAFLTRFSERLRGIWIPQVPLGLRRFQGIPPKYVADLIRIESNQLKIYSRITVKYWKRAMKGDPTYEDINLNNKNVLLIEGKVIAGHDAIGQLLVYREALLEDWTNIKVSLGIVASSFEPWVKEACKRLGILTWEIKV